MLAAGLAPGPSLAQTDPLSLASDGRVLPVLKSGWYLFQPYQFIDTQGTGTLTGIDVRFAKEFARRLGYFVEYDYLPWSDQIAGVADGSVDFVTGATPTAEREKFAYFTKPYRSEEVVLLVSPARRESLANLSTQEVVDRLKSDGFRLGVVDGFIFGSDILNAYVAENTGTDLIVPSESSVLNLRRLIDGEIDGLLEDRLAAIDIIWREGAFGKIAEVPLDSHSDVAFMFSKANFAPEVIDSANTAISAMKAGGLIEDIKRSFLIPLFFSQTIGSTWYWLVDLVGTVAFALSGAILGWRIGANIAGFFILSALPAIGGGIMRDILLARPIASIDSVQNITIISVIAVCGYAAYRIHNRSTQKRTVSGKFAGLFNALDAAGWAASR